MKKILVMFIAILAMGSINAQNIDTAIYNKLSDAAKKEIQAAQISTNLEQQMQSYSKVAGIGKEIGISVREGLTAIKDVTVDLSKTDVGKTTMYLIIWKVAGKDILGFVIGILLFSIGTILIAKSYFKTFSPRVLSEYVNEGLFKQKRKIYRDQTADIFWEYPNTAAMIHIITWIVIILISSILMFN